VAGACHSQLWTRWQQPLLPWREPQRVRVQSCCNQLQVLQLQWQQQTLLLSSMLLLSTLCLMQLMPQRHSRLHQQRMRC
jgi:hypothetical protein